MKNLWILLKNRSKSWINEINNHKYIIFLSLLFLILSGILDYLSGLYVDKKGLIAVDDFLLGIIPRIDLSFLFVYGYLFIMIIMFVYPLFFKVKKLHNVLIQSSLLIAVRSFFICMTHLKIPVNAISKNFPGILNSLSFTNDLFFSGHVALPFLGFLLFEEKPLKYLFLASSILMAFVVLSMHIHYSIDVFAAFFITYGTYKIGKRLFKSLDNIAKH